jgi:hypothetical protein
MESQNTVTYVTGADIHFGNLLYLVIRLKNCLSA